VSYSREVGERLRRVRVERGLSLQEVERSSGGRWKAAVIGSYERGDRNISATRLLELAEFYEVSPAQVLPGDAPTQQTGTDAMTIDLTELDRFGDRYAAMRRYLETIQLQRGDYNRRVLSIRGEDLRALAVIQDRSPTELVEELHANGVLGGNGLLDLGEGRRVSGSDGPTRAG
jgi:transcriptional regulator with XRE-family HTH domain